MYSSSEFNDILDKTLDKALTKDEAVFLLENVNSTDSALRLFAIASKVRQRRAGNVFQLDGFIGSITPCTTNPPCKYCSRSARNYPDHFEKPLTVEEIKLAAKFIEDTGTKRVEIGGGTPWKGAGKKVIDAVKAVKGVSSMDIWVNVGPALSRDDLIELKALGVKEVCSSLETINPDVFKEAKPGDSIEARMRLAEEINNVGLGLKSVMMVGIGSNYEDYVKHLFWLKRFKNLSSVSITGLRPIPGTPFQDRPMANPLEVAKVGAIARLILRDVDIGFGGMMNDPRLLPLWIMAGGNRAIHLNAHVHRVWSTSIRHPNTIIEKHGDLEFVNMLPLTTRYIKEMGMKVDVE